ncbi:MAG: response regulator [Acidimicrobiales bacterium]|nr:MAG: response regulator [Acidimicrobiales bacterium]
MAGGEATILLVEDDPDDVQLTEIAIREAGARVRLDVVGDGEDALRYLRRQSPYERARRPHLVLLDLNLPKLDGREVLREIKADEDLRAIPVIVLTTSAEEDDVLLSYRHHANSFITKPIDFDEFLQVVSVIERYWLEVVRLPDGR